MCVCVCVCVCVALKQCCIIVKGKEKISNKNIICIEWTGTKYLWTFKSFNVLKQIQFTSLGQHMWTIYIFFISLSTSADIHSHGCMKTRSFFVFFLFVCLFCCSYVQSHCNESTPHLYTEPINISKPIYPSPRRSRFMAISYTSPVIWAV